MDNLITLYTPYVILAYKNIQLFVPLFPGSITKGNTSHHLSTEYSTLSTCIYRGENNQGPVGQMPLFRGSGP